MKKIFVNPEISAARLTYTDAIMASGEQLVQQNVAINYSISDKDRSIDEKLQYWSGKNK